MFPAGIRRPEGQRAARIKPGRIPPSAGLGAPPEAARPRSELPRRRRSAQHPSALAVPERPQKDAATEGTSVWGDRKASR